MTEVIVYRNPMEAMFWNSMMNGGDGIFFFVIFAGLFWVFVAVQSDKLYRKIFKNRHLGYGTSNYAIWTAHALTVTLLIGTHFYSVYG